MIRILDIIISCFGLITLSPLMALTFLITFLDTGSPLFTQVRVGRNKTPFTMFKFRTMRVGTESVATHLAPDHAVTSTGKILRKFKLDELPQLINVLKGEMSLVGPRPCLFSQEELVDERERRGLYSYLPGITGLAQVNNIDMSEPKLLAMVDQEMVTTLNVFNYWKYIALTVFPKTAPLAYRKDNTTIT